MYDYGRAEVTLFEEPHVRMIARQAERNHRTAVRKVQAVFPAWACNDRDSAHSALTQCAWMTGSIYE